MALPAVGEAFSAGGAYVARSISEGFQTFGHKVSTMLSDYVMPTLRKCSNLAKTCFAWLGNALRTGTGAGVLLSIIGVGLMLVSQRSDLSEVAGGKDVDPKQKRIKIIARVGLGVLGTLIVAGGVTLAAVYGGAAWI